MSIIMIIIMIVINTMIIFMITMIIMVIAIFIRGGSRIFSRGRIFKKNFGKFCLWPFFRSTKLIFWALWKL